MNDVQCAVARVVERTVGHGKHCARSAVAHICRAWRIQVVDPEMAAFRALTAEEEAATAIFHALKRLRYHGADRLGLRDHTHKAAVRPFFEAISESFAKGGLNTYRPALIIDETGREPKLMTQLQIPGPGGRPLFAYPQPPLHFSVNVNDRCHDFTEELDRACSVHNVNSMIEYIRTRGNRRNRLLYATAGGVPKISCTPELFLLTERDITFQLLSVFLLIDLNPERQGFVEQAVTAFLKMLGRLPTDLSES